MKKLVIDRERWLRSRLGEEDVDGYLLDHDGKMCCLGFDCRFIQGIEPNCLLGIGNPSDPDTEEQSPPIPCSLSKNDISEAIAVNDRNGQYKKIPDAEQERLIAEIFARNGVEVVFEGGDS